ncbi:MAG TPA: TIR domain-containing protein [Pyrinomonadaceae bacterium]|jgi:small GTP-binding protein
MDFTEIGGSPTPGFTLRNVLRGHIKSINRIAWSPNGLYLASPCDDKTIRIWYAHDGACVCILQGHTDTVSGVAWSPDSQLIASSSNDGTLRLWEANSGKPLQTLVPAKSKYKGLSSIDWSLDGQRLACTSLDSAIHIWNANNCKELKVLETGTTQVLSISWSPDSQRLASASVDNLILLWDPASRMILQTLKGHKGAVPHIKWSPDGKYLASASADNTIHIWDANKGKLLKILEGHLGRVGSIAFSSNGLLLASKSDAGHSAELGDRTVRLWRCDTWANISVLDESAEIGWHQGIAFHPSLPVLATLTDEGRAIRIWELDESLLLAKTQDTVQYTTAKLVLVGDSGVGKTGLGWRLAHGEFKEHSSTHGQQFWVISELSLKRGDGTECEAVLWDLAGQHVYRQIHSIFLENISVALVLFDPTNRQEPLKGVQFWLEQLKGKGQLPVTVLVGARVDRGAPTLSKQELEQFCQHYDIRGGYISTSAFSSEGLDTLIEKLKAQIPWNEMTATVTTVTFKRIKDYVLALKEKPDREGVLVSPNALRKQLQATNGDWQFTDDEMMTAVGHLEIHGYVTVLRSSAGDQYILLTPDLLVTLASSIVLEADKHPRELGAVSETSLLAGGFQFDELAGLSPSESQILLDAATLRFLQHNICFRETVDEESLLIFPALIKQKRPLQDEFPSTDDISYVVRGRVENLYASLVVLLGYTPSFTRINQWQNQAQYEMDEGEICGFRVIEDREGEIELVLYYADQMPASGRAKFQELFEQFLYQRDVEVTPFPPIVCPNSHRQKRDAVMEAARERLPSLFCYKCGKQVALPSFDKPQSIGIAASPWLQIEEAAARLRSTYEAKLTKVKGYRRDWVAPRCYVSYLPEQREWAEKFINDLRGAGVYVVEQVDLVQPNDFVMMLDSLVFQRAWKANAYPDANFIKARLLLPEKERYLLSIVLEGNPCSMHNWQDCRHGDFCDETHYPVSLFDLVLELYAIPLNHAAFAQLRQALHEQWEQTLGQKKGDDVNSALKVFISYSHKDEEFKDELVEMLAGLQRQGIIDAWQDRRIEEGDEWYQAIQDAMNDCNLAILLVSRNFIASRFIQDEELPRFLQRRKEEGLRVVPIIVRPCKWQSEPVLKDLQALPKDGKAVITFSKDNGDRDQVWTDIADVIEKRAKAKKVYEI